MTTWIDFKALRAKLSFADVLKHYGVEAKVKGERAYALCPLPNHPIHGGNCKRTPSLSINMTRNIFQCFGCRASGNVVEFCALMEGFNPSDSTQFRAAALKIAQIFNVATDGTKPVAKTKATATVSESPPPASSLPVIVNAPLGFELNHLDPAHPYLTSRGYTPETVAYFGLGYCGTGLMKDRIAIPLHDVDGRLLGYAGRIIQDQIHDDAPKYLFPGARERNGKCYEFHKSLLLYNLHRLVRPVDDLIVVEGFASVWWLHQHGWHNSVALMGSSLAEAQATLLVNAVRPDGRCWVFTDGDEAGKLCAQQVLSSLAPQRFVRWIKLDQGQPTDICGEELAALLPPT